MFTQALEELVRKLYRGEVVDLPAAELSTVKAGVDVGVLAYVPDVESPSIIHDPSAHGDHCPHIAITALGREYVDLHPR